MNRLLPRLSERKLFWFRGSCSLPVRSKLLGEVEHVLLLHVFEFSAAFGFELVDVSADECCTTSSRSQVGKGGTVRSLFCAMSGEDGCS